MNNFIQSLAGYSLLCYFLQIKDRHNANILLDNQGHIVHIDFGFLLSNAPGKGFKFEKAPFKLTEEFVECMGGPNSSTFKKFRNLLWSGFIALVKHSQKIIILVEMMYAGFGDTLGCFSNKENTIRDLKNRFFPRPGMEPKHYFRHVDSLIEQSIDNWRTRWYDKFQYVAQGIFY